MNPCFIYKITYIKSLFNTFKKNIESFYLTQIYKSDLLIIGMLTKVVKFYTGYVPSIKFPNRHGAASSA